MVPKRDFLYLFIIMLLLFGTVTLCTIIFVVSEKAILGISVASTLVSIILAVLAIIYTYVDSSAQKDNVRQIKEATDRLEASVQEEKAIIESFSIELEKVSALKDELLARISETQEWRDGVLKQLKEMSEAKQGDATLEISEIEKVMNEEREKKKLTHIDHKYPNYLINLDSKVLYKHMLDILLVYPDGMPLDTQHFKAVLEATVGGSIPRRKYSEVLRELLKNGHIKETKLNGFTIYIKGEKQQ
ncbi:MULTISPECIES: hypothetical protein [Brevibacillus]|uniref:hypothetical protein n=1 Tax=Brevibacillus TaxID=55080 RepID=UPI003637984E